MTQDSMNRRNPIKYTRTGEYDTQLRLKEMIKLLILFRQREDKNVRNCQDKER